MARAYGSSAQLLMKREAVYGQAATGNYRIAAARGYDLAVLSELLPAAEAGLVEASSADQDRTD